MDPMWHGKTEFAAKSPEPRRDAIPASSASTNENMLTPTEFQRTSLEHRCNLDVCPELMSRKQRIVQRRWLILIPHEDKVDVVSPFSILVIGGGGF